MSIKHMQSVFDAEGLTHSEKIMLLAYCNYTDAHGYVWAGVPRISDDTGASESTVKRVRKELQERGLLATKRRVDSRTGRSTSNITRINLDLLASMKRAPREYDDNVIEELLFEAEEPQPQKPSDLRIGQSDPGPDLRIGQSDPASGVNLTSPEGQVNLTPNPSDEPSGSSSSGDSATTPSSVEPGEEEDAPSADPALDEVMARTDATVEEAEGVLESIEDHAQRNNIDIGSVARYVSGFGDRDLNRHLKRVRAQRAPEARAGTPVPRARTVCALHGIQGACPACRDELHGGGPLAQAVIDMYLSLGSDRERLRPELARHPVITELVLTG